MERVISEFYFVQGGCEKKMWAMMYPPMMYHAICKNDIERWLDHSFQDHVMFYRQISFFATVAGEGSVDHAKVLRQAQEALREKISVLFLSDRMEEGLAIITQLFHLEHPRTGADGKALSPHPRGKGRGDGEESSRKIWTVPTIRKTDVKVGERDIHNDPTIQAVLRERMKLEIDFYNYAVKLYEKMKAGVKKYVER